MRKTKIVCTLGPASEDPEVITSLIQAGADVIRLNFSHADVDWHRRSAERVRKIAAELGKHVAILVDLPGPKIRTSDGETVALTAGEMLRVVPGAETARGTIGTSCARLPKEVRPGDRILLSDGMLELAVEQTGEKEILCRVVRGGTLKPRQGINLPGVRLSVGSPTDEDIELLQAGLEMGADYVAISFVRSSEDVEKTRAAAGSKAPGVRFIAKIERPEAIEDIDAILAAADAVMVARGDLGVELPPEEVPGLQRMLIEKAWAADKPVITATQMLESMTENVRPTRAEVSDVAHAVWDGTDAVMLSAETASGRYPVEAAAVCARVAEEAEKLLLEKRPRPPEPSCAEDVIGMGAGMLSRELNAAAVAVATLSGNSARFVSMARPGAPILALSPEESTCRRAALYWGVSPERLAILSGPEELSGEATKAARRTLGVPEGSLVVLVYGAPLGSGAPANTLRLLRV